MPARTLYLTFDDGPDRLGTPPVLEILKLQQIPATFFVVAQTAARNSDLLARMIDDGHAIGNHSLDHGYGNFFRGKKALKTWVSASETQLRERTGNATIGFRPPAGVRMPELHSALRELKMPLVLWNRRFFDTAFSWTPERALRSLRATTSDAVILLHDRQHPKRLETFLGTLEMYIAAAKDRGFDFKKLEWGMTHDSLRPRGENS